MDAFEKFTKKVNAKFIEMSKGELFVMGALADKQEDELKNLSKEEILAQLAKL